MKAFLKVIASWILLTISTGTVQAAERIALVIGNSNYQHVAPLANPKNDSADIAIALENIGFEVTVATDLDFQGMRLALREFSDKSQRSDIAMVYYAGHGIEVDKHNYLIPTDARLQKDVDIKYEAMSLDLLNQAVAGAKSLRLILLDACRDNPFAKSMTRTIATRSIGSGLAPVEPTVGTLVSYAAKEGTVAADGEGRNSPYTKALIEHLSEPGLEINFLFRKVRDSVLATTNGQQEPFTYGSLPGKQIFLSDPAPKLTGNTPGTNTDHAIELTFWDSIKGQKNLSYFEVYLQKYPKGLFAEIARLEIERLKKLDAVAPDDGKPTQTAKLDAGDSQPGNQPSLQSQSNDGTRNIEELRIEHKECRELYRDHLKEGPIKAFALSSNGKICGASWNYSTKESATKAALDYCRQQKGKNCKIVSVSFPAAKPIGKECIDALAKWQELGGSKAFAISGNGQTCGWGYNFESFSAASDAAIESCRKQFNGDEHGCRVMN